MTFDVGDLVRLKSGGPRMTVADVSDDTIYCTWFNDKMEHKAEHFPIGVLEPAPKQQPGVGFARIERA